MFAQRGAGPATGGLRHVHRRSAIATLVTLLLAAMIAAGCGQFGKAAQGSDGGGTTGATGPQGAGSVTDKPFDEAEIKRAGCTEIETPENKGREHVDGDVEYETNPPTSGSHNPVPLDWGVYDEDQPTEKFVHNLEHGHIVIAYKGLSEEQYDELRGHVKRDKFHLVLLPRKANPKDGVYYLAWDARLYCEQPSAPALQKMITDYRDQGPELFMNDTEKRDEE